MEEKKIIYMENEVEEIEAVDEEETTMDKIKNSKPVAFMKKHGKKLAIAAGIGAAFLIGRALGEKDGYPESGSDEGGYDDDNVIEVEDYSVEEVSEENEE